MTIEFKVTRKDDKIVGISSNDPNLVDVEASLPVYTRDRISVSVYFLPPEVSTNFYRSLVRQMKGGSSEAD